MPLSRIKEYMMQLDNARMLHLQKIIKFSVGAFGVNQILEGVDDFLYGYDKFAFFVDSFVDDTISALADFFLHLIVSIDVIFKLFWLFHSEYKI